MPLPCVRVAKLEREVTSARQLIMGTQAGATWIALNGSARVRTDTETPPRAHGQTIGKIYASILHSDVFRTCTYAFNINIEICANISGYCHHRGRLIPTQLNNTNRKENVDIIHHFTYKDSFLVLNIYRPTT